MRRPVTAAACSAAAAPDGALPDSPAKPSAWSGWKLTATPAAAGASSRTRRRTNASKSSGSNGPDWRILVAAQEAEGVGIDTKIYTYLAGMA